ncbi:hypothetical protein NPIL_405811 [Nephila pilipes]|uniref:Uncharacterized protein n=1 Tax=Nephila pilipes TaxID=299642 RepID=A0A8X6PTA0_NEPPI|nr:hypothetical protein NPIL_405811 [Nephila pilipes]
MHDNASIDSDTGKSSVILDYNKTKGGVDVVNKLRETNTVARRPLKLPMTIFYSFLNIANINSQIMLQMSSPDNSKIYALFFEKFSIITPKTTFTAEMFDSIIAEKI